MSKKILYLAGILFTIVLGTLLFWYYCCNCGAKNKNLEPAVATADSIVSEEAVSEPVSPAPASAPDAVPDAAPDAVPDAAPDAVDWGAIRTQLNEHPLMLNFQAYETESVMQTENLNKLEEIIKYLSNNPDDGLLITGYSDISGSLKLNMKLSQGRADFLKDYLVQRGLDADKIMTSSKGPEDPVADNSLAEGRAKNRRAVVLIQ